MRSAKIALLLVFVLPAFGIAQTRDAAIAEKSPSAEAARAERLLAKIRAALGGEANLKQVRSLSLSGEYRLLGPAGEIAGEIKIDLLAPGKFLKSETSNPQPMARLTLLQAVNGDQVWFDRKLSRMVADDGSSEATRGQTGRTTPINTGTSGMRGTVSGTMTYRTDAPGRRTDTRTVLGMQIPTPVGNDRNTSISKVEEAREASAQNSDRANRPPGIENPDVKSALEKQLRKEFACLMFGWLLTPPSSFPLELIYAGEIKAEEGMVEAIEMAGPDDFAARLFVDQASSRPLMLSYREMVRRSTGYVVSADGSSQSSESKPEDAEEIAVQLYFADYRPVSGVLLPFQIVRAVNGVVIEEWKIEKYKINPDLKPKRFEKK